MATISSPCLLAWDVSCPPYPQAILRHGGRKLEISRCLGPSEFKSRTHRIHEKHGVGKPTSIAIGTKPKKKQTCLYRIILVPATLSISVARKLPEQKPVADLDTWLELQQHQIERITRKAICIYLLKQAQMNTRGTRHQKFTEPPRCESYIKHSSWVFAQFIAVTNSACTAV